MKLVVKPSVAGVQVYRAIDSIAEVIFAIALAMKAGICFFKCGVVEIIVVIGGVCRAASENPGAE